MLSEKHHRMLTKGCAVRVEIRGVLGPEYIDGTFVQLEVEDDDAEVFSFIEPGGWRETLCAYTSQITEINRTRIK